MVLDVSMVGYSKRIYFHFMVFRKCHLNVLLKKQLVFEMCFSNSAKFPFSFTSV